MTPPNTPPSGGPGINIPAAGAPQPNPQKQTVGISTPPQRPLPAVNPIEPSRMEKVRQHITQFKWYYTLLLCSIAAFLAVWYYIPKESRLTTSQIDDRIKAERDSLRKEAQDMRKKLAEYSKELGAMSNILTKTMDDNIDLIMAVRSNSLSGVTPPTNISTKASQTIKSSTQSTSTNHTMIQTEPANRVGSGIVTVNENHGNIEIVIKNGDGEKVTKNTNGPEKAEDIVPGLAEATGTESSIVTEKVIPSRSNGIRYYIPKGWSVKYKYYCSEDDFETFLNKGSQQVTKWEAIDVSSDGISESIWIRNISRRSIKLTFTLTPAK